MKDIERLHKDLAERFQDRAVDIDPAETETGSWFVSVPRNGDLPPVVVEWRPENGFGLSTPGPDDFGTGVDESFPNAKATFNRVVQLVLSGNPAIPPMAIRLAELRQAFGITQSELADRLGIKQANVSKVENRDDIQLSTLARTVEAMGGRLAVRALMPGGMYYDIDIPRARPTDSLLPDGLEIKTEVTVKLGSAPNPDVIRMPVRPDTWKKQN